MKYLYLLINIVVLLSFYSCDDSDIAEYDCIGQDTIDYLGVDTVVNIYCDTSCADCYNIIPIWDGDDIINKYDSTDLSVWQDCRDFYGLPPIDTIGFGTVNFLPSYKTSYGFDDWHKFPNVKNKCDTSYLSIKINDSSAFDLYQLFTKTQYDSLALRIMNRNSGLRFKRPDGQEVTDWVFAAPSKTGVTKTINIYSPYSKDGDSSSIELWGKIGTTFERISFDSLSCEDYLKVVAYKEVEYNKRVVFCVDDDFLNQNMGDIQNKMRAWLITLNKRLNTAIFKIDTSKYVFEVFSDSYDTNNNNKIDLYENKRATNNKTNESLTLKNVLKNKSYLKTKTDAAFVLSPYKISNNYYLKNSYSNTGTSNAVKIYANKNVTEADTLKFKNMSVLIGPMKGDTGVVESCYVDDAYFDNTDTTIVLLLKTSTSFQPQYNHPNTDVITIDNTWGYALNPNVIDGDFLVISKNSVFGTPLGNELVVHEFGHTQELFHVNDPKNVMNPYIMNIGLKFNYRQRSNMDYVNDVELNGMDDSLQNQWSELRQLENF